MLLMVQFLLCEAGANIREVDNNGFTALLLCCEFAEYTCALWLLEYGGAEISDVTSSGETVWDLLRKHVRVHPAGMTPLLRTMVLRSAPPAGVYVDLVPIVCSQLLARYLSEIEQVVEEGGRLRLRLPAYLAKRRTL
jgi:hypothetical protein